MFGWNDIIRKLLGLDEEEVKSIEHSINDIIDENEGEKTIMCDINGLIDLLEVVKYIVSSDTRQELERIGDVLKTAHDNKDWLAYTQTLGLRKDLKDMLEKDTQKVSEELDILYKAKELCSQHGFLVDV